MNSVDQTPQEKSIFRLIGDKIKAVFTVEDSEPTVEVKPKKFGLINGRFQPFHRGHQEIVNEILLEGLTPIIVLGSSNPDRDKGKNPLTYAQRKELIRLIYPNVPIVFIYGMDFPNWNEWYSNLITEIGKVLTKNFDETVADLTESVVVYHNNKEVDVTSFEFNGKQYENTWYTDIFDDTGFETREVAFVKREDIKIDSNARDIRENLEGLKHLLDARVYLKLKEWGW